MNSQNHLEAREPSMTVPAAALNLFDLEEVSTTPPSQKVTPPKRQPQGSPFESDKYAEFFSNDIEIKDFNSQNFAGASTSSNSSPADGCDFQPLSSAMANSDSHNLISIKQNLPDFKIDSHSYFSSFSNPQSSVSEMAVDIVGFMQRPSVMISFILLCTTMIMFIEFTSQQAQIMMMHKQLESFSKHESQLQHQIQNLKRKVNDVQEVEDDLLRKEIKLEAKVSKQQNKTQMNAWLADLDPWSEEMDEDFHVNMKPLFPHVIEAENKAISKAKDFGNHLTSKIRNLKKALFEDE